VTKDLFRAIKEGEGMIRAVFPVFIREAYVVVAACTSVDILGRSINKLSNSRSRRRTSPKFWTPSQYSMNEKYLGFNPIWDHVSLSDEIFIHLMKSQ
jgi:hypothetical protein